MSRTACHWKDEPRGQGLSSLADLSVEHCVDDLFRPFLSSATKPPEVPAVPASEADTTGGQRFEVVVRSLPRCWPASRALVPPEQTTSPPAPPQMPPPENFVRGVSPKTVAPSPPPLPHEVREELLELRAEVLHAARTRQLQTLMLCGVEGGAGTSFVAGQLSRLLAEFTQIKVAFLTLVPHRERKPLRVRTTPAASLPQLQLLLRRTELPNLVELASANGTITLTELLCQCPTTDVLRQIKAAFDLIVIDAPAIALHSEAAALAALMDGVILVAKPNVTPLRRMDRAHRRLRKAHANVLGMVFNRQRRP